MRAAQLFFLVTLCYVAAQQSTPTPTTLSVQAQFRDVWPCSNFKNCGKDINPNVDCSKYRCHPDFERYLGDDRNLVNSVLAADGLPTLNLASPHPSVTDANTFYAFYHDLWPNGTATGYTIYVPKNITLTQLNPGCNTTLTPGCDRVFQGNFQDFFALDGLGFGNYVDNNGGRWNRNFAFTMMFVSIFQYTGGEKFEFVGDDDVWVYINGKLVVDLGGIHGAQGMTVDIDRLGLTKGNGYDFRIFYNERHTSQSTFKMTTSLALQCPYIDHCNVCGGNGQSCCKGCTAPDACTIASCGVFSEKCETKPLVCDTSIDNKCFTTVCDKLKGCVIEKTNCDDGNPCTVDNCFNSTGCSNIMRTDNNPCTNDVCTPTNMTYPAKCDTTSDKCTQRWCDNGNCRVSTKQCPDTVCGIQGACVPSTGECVYQTRPCSNPDPCQENNRCDATYGCVSTPKQCTPSTAECTVTSCNAGTCQSVLTPSTSCKLCDASCKSDNCMTRSCNFTIGKCVETPKCPDLNLCNKQTCDSNTGKCSVDTTDCSSFGNACNPGTCDVSTGKCVKKPSVCDDGSLCTIDTCAEAANGTAVCKNTPTCPSTFCNATTCDPKTGVCAFKLAECDSGNLCAPAHCDIATDQCVTLPLPCDDGIACTTDDCDRATGACTHKSNCNDGSNCTVDTCLPSGNCSFVDLPIYSNASNLCQLWYCDRVLGNISTPLVCYPENNCECQVDRGCVCKTFPLSPAAIAGISAGAVAGIAVGAAAGAALLGFGAKKGFDAYQAGAMASATVVNNPLHEGPANDFVNPAYEGQA